MNQSYRLVWSAVRSAWAVVSELAKSHAKLGAVMLSGFIAVILPMQGQAALISSGDFSVGDFQVWQSVSADVTEFEAGGSFGVDSTNLAILKASGTGSMVDLGGGTYHLSTESGAESAIESLGNLGNGRIDFSKASKVTLITGHRAGLKAGESGHIEISDLDLTHSHSSGMTNIASILSQDEGSIINLHKAKIENSTSGAGITSLNGGQVTINELTYLSTNSNPALLVTGKGASKMTIGSLTGSKSNVSNASGGLITNNVNMGKLTVDHVDLTGHNTGEEKLVDLSAGSMTTANKVTIKNTGTGVAIGLDGVGTTLNLTDSSVEGKTSGTTKLLELSTGSIATVNQSTIKNTGTGVAIGLTGVGTTLNLSNSSVEGNTTIKLVDLSEGSLVTTNQSMIKNVGMGVAIGLTGAETTLNLTESMVESMGSGLELGVGTDTNGTTATIINSKIISAGNGISVLNKGTLNLTDSTITATGISKTAVMQTGEANQLNLSGNNSFIALAQDAKGMFINSGHVFVADGAKLNLVTTSGTALLMQDAKWSSATDTAQASCVINTGSGDLAAIDFKGTTVELGSLNQEMTVKTGQKQVLLLDLGSNVQIGRLSVTQRYAATEGNAIQLKENSILEVKQLTLDSNQVGIDVSGSKLTVGEASTPSIIKVTGDNHAGIIGKNFSSIVLTQTNIETDGSGSDGINIADLTSVEFSGTNNITTKGAKAAIGLKVGTESSVKFAGTNNISTAGANSTGILLEVGATAFGTLSGAIETSGTNAVGIQSGAANLAVANSMLTTSGIGSTGVSLVGGNTTLTNNVIITNADKALGIKVGKTSLVNFEGTNNISTTGDHSTALLFEDTAMVAGVLTGAITTAGANAVGVESTAANLAIIGSTINTAGVRSMGIHLTGGSTTMLDNMVTTEGEGSEGIVVGDSGMVNFAGINNIATNGHGFSTALRLEEGAIAMGAFMGSIQTTGSGAIGIQSSAANLHVEKTTVMTAGLGSTGINLIGGHTTLTDNVINTTGRVQKAS